MQVLTRTHRGVLYISLNGELDEKTAEYTRLALEQVMLNAVASQIVIDLANLTFMDFGFQFAYSVISFKSFSFLAGEYPTVVEGSEPVAKY